MTKPTWVSLTKLVDRFSRCWGGDFLFLKKTLRVSPAYSKEHGRDRDKEMKKTLNQFNEELTFQSNLTQFEVHRT